MKLRFTFDRVGWIEVDVSEHAIEEVNKAIWILLHTLNAKEVHLIK